MPRQVGATTRAAVDKVHTTLRHPRAHHHRHPGVRNGLEQRVCHQWRDVSAAQASDNHGVDRRNLTTPCRAHHRPHELPIGAGVRVQDGDVPSGKPGGRGFRVEERRQAFGSLMRKASIRRGVRFGCARGGEKPSAEDNVRAARCRAFRRRLCSLQEVGNGILQIAGAVRARMVGWALRSGEGYRNARAECHVHGHGGFLHGVRTVYHHHASQPFTLGACGFGTRANLADQGIDVL